MAIGTVQQGVIAQQEFAKLVMLGSGGRIEVAAPLTDDERRDYEIHVRGQYGFALAVQVKSTKRAYPNTSAARYLNCRFKVRTSRVVNDRSYWYFVGILDIKVMRYADPVFLIPSTFFHRAAFMKQSGDYQEFRMRANVEPHTHDRWGPYRVNTLQLGKRMLEIMADLRKHRDARLQLADLTMPPGTLMIHPTAAQASRRKVTKAA